MSQRVRIPEPLRDLTNDEQFVEVNAATIADVIKELTSRFPGLTAHLLDEKGALRRFVNFYVNEEDIRFLQNCETPLNNGDCISISPALIDARSAIAAIDVANRLSAGEKIES